VAILPPDVRAALHARFPDVISADGDLDENGPLVPEVHHLAYARALKDVGGYRLYVSVVGSHWPATDEAEETFEVATVLRNTATGHATWWRVLLPVNKQIETLFDLFAGADWQEREQFDLVGVRFRNHPDLRRLMLPEDWDGHPLQKHYAIDTPHKPWR
jgi:NADH-quinone oxidoreductase subunit C